MQYDRTMIVPFRQDESFLADVAQARSEADRLHIWWLGQSGFLVQWRGQHLLFDPYLSDSLTVKYAATDKPHVRMTERVIAPERLDFVDVVTSSHNHTDHLDSETLRPLMNVNPTLAIVVPAANADFAADRLGVPVDRLTTIAVDTPVASTGMRLTAIPAAHEALERDDHGHHHFLGYVAEIGPWTIYHSGDTLRYPGMAERLRQWHIDVALLPINGSRPERQVAGNLDGAEAAHLAHDIGAKFVLPCHFEMFVFNTESPDRFMRVCKALGQPYRVLRAGERWSKGNANP